MLSLGLSLAGVWEIVWVEGYRNHPGVGILGTREAVTLAQARSHPSQAFQEEMAQFRKRLDAHTGAP